MAVICGESGSGMSSRLLLCGAWGQDGEKVVYSKYAGTELKLQGKEYVILKVRSLPPGAAHCQPPPQMPLRSLDAQSTRAGRQVQLGPVQALRATARAMTGVGG